jgi:hypothetical protein
LESLDVALLAGSWALTLACFAMLVRSLLPPKKPKRIHRSRLREKRAELAGKIRL